MIKIADISEARTFLAQNPDIKSIDLLIPDLNGIFRGKRVFPDALEHVFEDGILLSKSMFASDITGATSEGSGIGLSTGDMDCPCLPVSGSLQRVPWKTRPTAQLQLAMHDASGAPFAGDPQAIVDNLVARFHAMNLIPVVAIEMEFYLIDGNGDSHHEPLGAVSPVTGHRPKETQVYSISDLDDYSEFIDEIMDVTREQQLPADVAVAEYAPGQYEINLVHQADAQLACRHGLWLKRAIKGVAQKHGFNATFMPKPFRNLAGNGTHIHISLLDRDGDNLFAQGGTKNQYLRQAIAGLIATMSESMLLLAPGANSYRRFRKGMYVPVTPNWGFNNRTVALRVPAGSPQANRIEHRVAGADVNPFLLTACILAGIHHGLTHELEPPPRVTGDAFADEELAKDPDRLPLSWQDAIQRFESADILPDYLGQQFCQIFLAAKRQELEKFSMQTTPLEYDWYLRNS